MNKQNHDPTIQNVTRSKEITPHMHTANPDTSSMQKAQRSSQNMSSN
jgi:hypothetical protein